MSTSHVDINMSGLKLRLVTTKEIESSESKYIFHVYNRGVKKHVVFKGASDYRRFTYCLYKTNNREGGLRGSYKKPLSKWPEQDKLVEILKWSALPNHFHLLLYGTIEDVGEFCRRLSNAYTKYSNIKYDESGHVFQNRTKVQMISNDGQYMYIPYYVELNPLDVNFPGWKSSCIADIKAGVNFAQNYKWSSLRNYVGVSDEFEEVINKDAFYELYDFSPEGYEKELGDWIKNIPELETFGAKNLI